MTQTLLKFYDSLLYPISSVPKYDIQMIVHPAES